VLGHDINQQLSPEQPADLSSDYLPDLSAVSDGRRETFYVSTFFKLRSIAEQMPALVGMKIKLKIQLKSKQGCQIFLGA
jgi:hypothetical protein